MKYSANILDTYQKYDESHQLITLRQWIHQSMKFTFIPDVPDETLNRMNEKDLTDLVKTLEMF